MNSISSSFSKCDALAFQFWTQQLFKYDILAMPRLTYPAVHPDNDQYIVYTYPYHGLGCLTSHVQLQFVVINSAQKLTRKT